MKICDSYTFKHNDVLMNKPIYVGFDMLELSQLHMYETYYNKLQPYFGQENIQLQSLNTGSFILSMKTETIFKDLKK